MSLTSALAQKSDVMPKGQFLEIYNAEKTYDNVGGIYSADASKLSTEWTSNDFSLETINGNQYFSTNGYAPNANKIATSNSISLPNIVGKQRIIMQIEQSFETESFYDFIYVNVNGQEVYRKSGKTSLMTDYIDLTSFAGQTVQLSLQLTSDGSEQIGRAHV